MADVNADMVKEQDAHVEHVGRLLLTDQEALARARQYPDRDEPIYIIFAPDDKENPRNWSYARKYYITTYTSLLNAVT